MLRAGQDQQRRYRGSVSHECEVPSIVKHLLRLPYSEKSMTWPGYGIQYTICGMKSGVEPGRLGWGRGCRDHRN